MRPLTRGQARQDFGRRGNSPIYDYKLVVLGVMFPDVFSGPPSGAATEEASHLLKEVPFIRPTTGLIFHDPFSPDENKGLRQHASSEGNGRDQQELRRRKAAKGGQGSRREAIQAVVSDLARLAARNQDHENG